MYFYIGNIQLPAKVQEAMQMQVEAERKKRAAILESEGKREAEINIAEGRRQATILSSGNMEVQLKNGPFFSLKIAS